MIAKEKRTTRLRLQEKEYLTNFLEKQKERTSNYDWRKKKNKRTF